MEPVGADGKWSGAVAKGGVGRYGTVIAAFLIPSPYDPPFVRAGGCSASRTAAERAGERLCSAANPNQRRITFAGREWLVKSTAFPSARLELLHGERENVWTDDKGKLHLRITHRDGRWELCGGDDG